MMAGNGVYSVQNLFFTALIGLGVTQHGHDHRYTPPPSTAPVKHIAQASTPVTAPT